MRSVRSWVGSLRAGWRFLTTRYLVVASVPLLVAQVICASLGLGRNVLLTNLLSKADYAAINYLLGWVSVVSLLGLPGLNVAVAQYVARGHWETIRLGLRRRLLLAPLPMIALVSLGWMGIRPKQGEVIRSLWFLTAFFFPTAQVLGLVGSILGALRRFRRLAAYRVARSAAFLLAAAIGPWLWPGRATSGIILFQWLLLSFSSVWFWTRLRRLEPDPVPLLPSQRRRFYRFGTHMTVLGAIGQVRGRIGALLLGSFVSFSSLADYAVGNLFFEQMRAVWRIYYGVSYPRLVNLSPHDRWRQVGRELRIATPAFAALTGVVGVGLSFVIPWLFSAKYASSLAYTWILLFAFICSVPGGFFEMYFRLEESERQLYRIRLISDSLGALLPPLLLALWGPLGVPAGRACATLAYSLAGFTLYRRHRQ